MDEPSYLSEARQRLISDRLALGQSVVAASLAAEFGVSEGTIRRDLRFLATQGLCTRVYGGALPLSPASTSLAVRTGEDVERKRSLGRAALPFVERGQTLFLDTSSTILHFAPLLPRDLGLTVVTHSLPIASALMERSDIALVLIGGPFHRTTGGCFGPRALEDLRRLRIDLLVLGACALSAREGLAAFESVDADFKSALLEQSGETVLMMTNDKLETTAPFRIAPLSAVRHLVLEHDAPATVVAGLRTAGCDITHAAALSS